jgi:hypothetical protein
MYNLLLLVFNLEHCFSSFLETTQYGKIDYKCSDK